MTRLLPTVAAAAMCLGAPALAPAQVVTVDEGSFTITQNGQAAGREDFRIRSTPAAGGAEYVASATVALGDRRLSPDLRADGRGSLIAYRLETRAGGDTEERLTGQVGRGRFSAQLKTPRGESTREYVVSNGALVLDDDVYHQYYFLGIGGRSGAVPVVIPRRNVQVTMQVQRQGAETVSVGGQDIDATHLRISEPGGERHVWVDGRGRVLKVTVPARGVTVTRDDPPR